MSDAVAANSERLTPVTASERLELIDILRGFALSGILLVNFWGAPGDAVNRLDEVVNAALWVGGQFDPEAFDPAAVKFDNPRKRWDLAFRQ